MQIYLEELPHQREALDALLQAMPQAGWGGDSLYANPELKYAGEEKHFIDIKMETGTGKTYVYTRAMLELQQKLGLFKFIIVVPSLAIKEGTKNFIESAYARQHFAQFFPNTKIALHTINKGSFDGKKGRKHIPEALRQFHDATINDRNTIQCLLLSDKGFLDREDSALFKSDYEQNFFGGSNCPAEALADTRPVVMIDEPHRLKRDGKSYRNVMAHIKPQMIVRFGATFPAIKGETDYYQSQPQFDLGAVAAFNQDLVKGVSVQFPLLPELSRRIFKVKSVTNKALILAHEGREYEIKAGGDLSEAGEAFEGGVRYEGGKKLSNDLELVPGMKLAAGVFSNSYQEILLRQALDAHFATERENFHREGYRVKTNALFFIDSIASYREQDGWLKQIFERLLREKLKTLLQEHSAGDYHAFLSATLRDIAGAHGGYFAKDWGEADSSAIAEEMQDILHKERTLPFKKAGGGWNIRRFFFSKWTLREGWDNPNVFTICKLRSSGSEISKLQEVGRGLRLPVDEEGNRLSGEEWRLNFIIGWNEQDFAQKLVGEINRDAPVPLDTEKLTEAMIKIICERRKINAEVLLEKLDADGIITRSNAFKPGGYDKLLQTYPELTQSRLKSGKITAQGERQAIISLRRENWQKIAALWQELAQRYMLEFTRLGEGAIDTLFANALHQPDVFDDNQTLEIRAQSTQKAEGEISLSEQKTAAVNKTGWGQMPYAKFVETLAKQTSLPLPIIHRQLWRRLQELRKDGLDKAAVNARLNRKSCDAVIAAWRAAFAREFAQLYQYKRLDFSGKTSVYEKSGAFVSALPQNVVGTQIAYDISNDARNLYEEPAFVYDSETEHEVEKIKVPEQISVFGKIPRRAIKVPTYTGGSTTPDFIYVIEKGEAAHLVLLLETKAEYRRDNENYAIVAQQQFFKERFEMQWVLVTDPGKVMTLLRNFVKTG
ncbi:type III restriction-modification system endonuclease [Candidatus Tokpelaia sp.]|uniref:type III restriction-modification system endonuclease n=1 Tax=Candidatus Tokpelaia sp. TaxID=2233777 RepID=UPI00123C153C|nr:type III restriction-modification system endonuclease [Candidatus Tokpelaia sp.]KAA6406322.1 type III restriction-modification system endonuclease [Candidatus Tokpelaia sp.]